MVTKVQQLLKSFDLFGEPVQLQHQGQRFIKTSLGGCVSLVMLLVILVGAAMRFKQVYFEPEFYAFPANYDFSPTSLVSDFQVSPLAIGLMLVDSNLNFT